MNKYETEFKCAYCHEFHDFPKNAIFPTCKPILDLLAQTPKEVFRSELVEKFKQNLGQIQAKIDEFEKHSLRGADKVNEHCEALKADVRHATEETIEQLNELQAAMINQISEYQAECTAKLNNSEENVFDTKVNIDEMKMFLIKWEKYLKQLVINEQDVLEANLSAIGLRNKMTTEYLKLNDFLFNYKRIEYRKRAVKSNEDLLGCIEIRPVKSQLGSPSTKKLLNRETIKKKGDTTDETSSSSKESTFVKSLKIWNQTNGQVRTVMSKRNSNSLIGLAMSTNATNYEAISSGRKFRK